MGQRPPPLAPQLASTTRAQLPPATITFAHAVNSVFPSGAHYVTIFMRATAPVDAQPRNTEPHKCGGWHWVPWCQLAGLQPLFLPLEKLILGREYSPLGSKAGRNGQPQQPQQVAKAEERQLQ